MQQKRIVNDIRTGMENHCCAAQHHETEFNEKDAKFLEALWCEVSTISTDEALDFIESDADAIDEVSCDLDRVVDPKPYDFSLIENPKTTLKCSCTAGILCPPCATLRSRATSLVNRSGVSYKRQNFHAHTLDPRIPQVPFSQTKQQLKRDRSEILARWKDKRAKRARRGGIPAQNCTPKYSSRASVARQRKRVGGRFVKEAKMVTAKYQYKGGQAIICI